MTNQDERPAIMAVHAHPDDEVFSTGITLAKYGAMGYRTILVTCTDGAAGEVFDPTLSEAEKQQTLAELVEVRKQELAESVRVLGITDHEYLGYRDSGMMGTADNDNPESFHRAVFHDAVGRLVKLIQHYRPQVIISYDEFGSYGHPDHLQAQRIATIAFGAAGEPRLYNDKPKVSNKGEGQPEGEVQPEVKAEETPETDPTFWQPAKLYYTLRPRNLMLEMGQEMRNLGIKGWWDDPEYETRLGRMPDRLVTTRIDGREFIEAKIAAFKAHRTQIAPDSFVFTVPPELFGKYQGYEYFALMQHRLSQSYNLTNETEGYEEDLLTGIVQ